MRCIEEVLIGLNVFIEAKPGGGDGGQTLTDRVVGQYLLLYHAFEHVHVCGSCRKNPGMKTLQHVLIVPLRLPPV